MIQNWKVIGMLVATVGIGAHLGCSKDEPAVDSSRTPSGNAADGSGSGKTGAIAAEEVEGKLTTDFPSADVPLYPGRIIKSRQRLSDPYERPEFSVQMDTPDDFDKVDAAIRDSYSKDGWKIATDNKSGLGGRILITRGTKYIVTITYDAMGDEVLISYGVSEQM